MTTMKTPFFWPVRVYYEDTDAGGVVYHANYLKFFERARSEHLRSIGFELDELRRSFDIVFAVRSVQVGFLKPALFNDFLWVSAQVSESKHTSFTYTQEIRRGTPEGEKLCEATIRIVCLSDSKWRPVPLPGLILERIKNAI